jgi:hypothetical protein
MAHIKFNHLNAAAFNSFVPVATTLASNKVFNNILFWGGVAFVVWLVLKDRPPLVIKDNLDRNKE